ncbi:hypothetical protein JVU11DRAFT_2492 [Chiua virens]|nr:hypothetical protein JVU11DRAFT_2492 [Chiua virens]
MRQSHLVVRHCLLCPPGHPRRSSILNNLALYLSTRYEKLGGMDGLDESVSLGREALLLHPPGNPLRSSFLSNLGKYLLTRYKQLGMIDDLTEAVLLGREALLLCPSGHPDRSLCLDSLGLYLSNRYNRLGGIDDLNEAVTLGREALLLRPSGHPDRPSSLNNLEGHLSTRYKQLGGIDDLDEAVTLGQEALLLCPSGHPRRPSSLNNLGLNLSTRYNRLGVIDDLDEAVTLGRETLALCPLGHSLRDTSLTCLATYLFSRYHRLGEIDNLDEAVVFGREAILLRPSGHPARPTSLSNLGGYLSTRYNRLGGIDDLEEAVTRAREALLLCPSAHPERFSFLNNLGFYLTTRYYRFKEINNLNEAVTLLREALLLCPSGHTDRPSLLSNLGDDLSARYKRLGVIDDLDEAVVLAREALLLRPSGHPGRSSALIRLGHILFSHYNHLFGPVDDLDEAVTLGREALLLCPSENPGRPSVLGNLGNYLTARYIRLERVDDVDEASQARSRSTSSLPIGAPAPVIVSNRSWELAFQFATSGLRKSTISTKRLNSVAQHFFFAQYKLRYVALQEPNCEEELFGLYVQLSDIPQVTSLNELSAIREWITAAERFQHPSTVLAYQTILRLLVHHLTILPPLPQHLDIVKKLTSSLAVDAFSAYLRHRSPTNAIELLEHGRGVFWSQLTRLSSSLDDVIASGAMGNTLAAKFTRLTSLILHALDSPGPHQHDQVSSPRSATCPGLSRFLLPSLFSDLQQAASGGPVIVVNASEYSCDALIVFVDREPVHVPLSLVTRRDVQDMSSKLRNLTLLSKRMDVAQDLRIFLRKLWDNVVSRIIDVLQTVQPLKTRIWWCPTAEFSLLPLHAAGPFRKGQRNLPELYISSYTPTLNALIRARQGVVSNAQGSRKSIVGIGQANASGQGELLSVGTELSSIGQLVDSLATFSRVEGTGSCISRVIEKLEQNEWVHFACHGIPNRQQPFNSAFALHDGRLTIQRIIQCQLKNPEFVYLSACHTTVGDKDSPDEVIHLAAAMQFVGFRSVIGTMWGVDDGEANRITSTFYKHLLGDSADLDYTRAAFALNRTMRELKDIPFDQRVLYIHLGA